MSRLQTHRRRLALAIIAVVPCSAWWASSHRGRRPPAASAVALRVNGTPDVAGNGRQRARRPRQQPTGLASAGRRTTDGLDRLDGHGADRSPLSIVLQVVPRRRRAAGVDGHRRRPRPQADKASIGNAARRVPGELPRPPDVELQAHVAALGLDDATPRRNAFVSQAVAQADVTSTHGTAAGTPKLGVCPPTRLRRRHAGRPVRRPAVAGRVVVVGSGRPAPTTCSRSRAAALERAPRRFVRTAAPSRGRRARGRRPHVHVVRRRVRRRARSRVARTRRSSTRSSRPPREHGEVVYAVPGQPGGRRAHGARCCATRRRAVELEVVPGLSFADLAWARLGVDPMARRRARRRRRATSIDRRARPGRC